MLGGGATVVNLNKVKQRVAGPAGPGGGGEMAPAGASICPSLYLIIAVLIDTEAAEIAGVLPTEQS